MNQDTKQAFFFSVIVPIYKVEPYLNQCVRSVLNQSCNKYELILVDDGSPDMCGNMCDEYAKDNENVKVIHKDNGGLSSARNAGLEIAQGEYVIFLDSDDFWNDNNALMNIYNYLQESNADLLVFNAQRYYGSGRAPAKIINRAAEREKITDNDAQKSIAYMIKHNIFKAAAWNKVIRRDIISKNNMKFKEGYLSEDMDWCGDMLLFCGKFDYYDSAFYCYRQQRKGSITEGNADKLVADKLYMCKKGLNQAKSLSRGAQKLIGSYYAYEYSVAIGVSGGVKNKKLISEMRELEPLLEYDISDKVKKVNKLRRIIGFGLTRQVLCFFVKIK